MQDKAPEPVWYVEDVIVHSSLAMVAMTWSSWLAMDMWFPLRQ